MRRFLVFAYAALFIAACSPQEPQTEPPVELAATAADSNTFLWQPAGATYVFECEHESSGMRCIARAQQQDDADILVLTA